MDREEVPFWSSRPPVDRSIGTAGGLRQAPVSGPFFPGLLPMSFEPNLNENEDPSVLESERRASERREATGRAVLRIGNTSIEASVQNRSAEGFLVVINEPVVLELELGEGAARHVERAYVRRLGSLPGGRYGIGLELVSDDPVE